MFCYVAEAGLKFEFPLLLVDVFMSQLIKLETQLGHQFQAIKVVFEKGKTLSGSPPQEQLHFYLSEESRAAILNGVHRLEGFLSLGLGKGDQALNNIMRTCVHFFWDTFEKMAKVCPFGNRAWLFIC
jgi:hypothetical protein